MNLQRIAAAVQWLVLVATMTATVMLFTLGGPTGDAGGRTEADPALIEAGAAVYVAHCQICHGASGEGGTGPPLAGDLRERFPDPAAQMAIIVIGPKSMPEFGTRLDAHELEAVVAFTREGL